MKFFFISLLALGSLSAFSADDTLSISRISSLKLKALSDIRFLKNSFFVNLTKPHSPLISQNGECSVILNKSVDEEKILSSNKEMVVRNLGKKTSSQGLSGSVSWNTVYMDVANMNSVSKVVCGFPFVVKESQGRLVESELTIKELKDSLARYFEVEIEIKNPNSYELD